jgi:hypothetical protein
MSFSFCGCITFPTGKKSFLEFYLSKDTKVLNSVCGLLHCSRNDSNISELFPELNL